MRNPAAQHKKSIAGGTVHMAPVSDDEMKGSSGMEAGTHLAPFVVFCELVCSLVHLPMRRGIGEIRRRLGTW